MSANWFLPESVEKPVGSRMLYPPTSRKVYPTYLLSALVLLMCLLHLLPVSLSHGYFAVTHRTFRFLHRLHIMHCGLLSLV